ncbi:hypothetical protein Gotur_035958 [Gossypium turneri]
MGGMDLGLQPVGQTVKELGFRQSKVGCRKSNGSGLNIVGFSKLGISFGDNIGSHVNGKGTELVVVVSNDNKQLGNLFRHPPQTVLDLEKHLVIVFKENSKPCKRKILGVNGDNGSRKEAYIPKAKGLIYKGGTSRSSRKLNRTIRNHRDNFKSVGTTQGKLKEQRGHASLKFPRIFREYNREYKIDIARKKRVNSFKADKIIANMGFQFSNKVKAIDFFGGIWVGWKEKISEEEEALGKS